MFIENLRFFVETRTFALNPVRPGHEIIKKTQVCVGRMFGNFSKKQLKILVGTKLVGLGCFNEAVEYGTGFCTIIVFDQDGILPTYGEWTDSCSAYYSDIWIKVQMLTFL